MHKLEEKLYMCSLDYESILHPEQKDMNTEYIEEEEFAKVMEGPGGYFREPGGYIIDMRKRK